MPRILQSHHHNTDESWYDDKVPALHRNTSAQQRNIHTCVEFSSARCFIYFTRCFMNLGIVDSGSSLNRDSPWVNTSCTILANIRRGTEIKKFVFVKIYSSYIVLGFPMKAGVEEERELLVWHDFALLRHFDCICYRISITVLPLVNGFLTRWAPKHK